MPRAIRSYPSRVFYLAVSLLLSGCGSGEVGDGELPAAERAQISAIDTAGLTGLYEGARGERTDQMCVIDRGMGRAYFGLVVWGDADHSCSGVGQAVRDGEILRLNMAGDQECRIEARISEGRVTLPSAMPEGCAYYCGARAEMGGAAFQKVGDTAEEAMRAADLVGDPLCAGIPTD